MSCRCIPQDLKSFFESILTESTDQELLDSINRIKNLPEEEIGTCIDDPFLLANTLEECKACAKCLLNRLRNEAQKRGLIDDNLTKIVVVASVATAFGLLFAAFFTQK